MYFLQESSKVKQIHGGFVKQTDKTYVLSKHNRNLPNDANLLQDVAPQKQR